MFKKVLHIGTLPKHDGFHNSGLFIKAEINGKGELSISGVIGPRQSGNADGGCGQIDLEFAHRSLADDDERYLEPIQPEKIIFSPGWNREKWLDLLDIWSRWHLNGMVAACEHQRQDFDTKKKLTIVTYQLNSEILTEQNRIKESALQGLKDVGQVNLTKHDQYILALPWELTSPAETPLTVDLAKHYKERSRETKTAGWVYPKDHPEGVLAKPCPECGYKYGTQWLKEPLPQSVIDFLTELPETDLIPAWV